MVRTGFSWCMAAMFLVAGALAQQSSRTPEQPLKMGQAGANTFVGIVSDSLCMARHRSPDKSPEECTRTCVRHGARYTLVAGEKIFILEGDASELARLSGQRVRITGARQGDVIQVGTARPTE